MKNILLLEDEEAAVRRISKMVLELLPDAKILAALASIAEGIQWLSSNPSPDLILSDIHLADGQSFEIFRRVTVTTPIIFITAYDQYALEAFKVNSIDYILKPVKKEELQRALQKFNNLSVQSPSVNIEKLLLSLQKPAPTYKERFAVRYGEHIKTIETTDIAYFYTENKVTFLVTKDNKRYVVDHHLDQLETLLNPKNFFRINRQFIICFNAITEMFSYSKSRVLIKLNPPCKHETIVSAERSAHFKTWIDG
ncbi:LytR/AlgR family response regulator transcription factor [Aridibaculum aurantiacum]|uniref:LytR/AlgR family response regulator transcription factor n=1 Tax=Aridibaculum aurantiacum TaxID=2810307 RepID=UPI001A960770|nr:LytTR family DNA-binding domain-containing protein [Aridibaculum aurantiacum]